MTFALRKAAPSDAEFVLALFAQPHVRAHMHGPADRDAFVRSAERGDAENYIVEREGSPFGNLVFAIDDGWLMTVRAIAMSQPRRGGGRFALAWAIRHGFDTLRVHRIFLEVVADNDAARRLYEALGFRREGVYRDGYRHDDGGGYADLVAYGMLANDGDRAAESQLVALDHVQLAIPVGGETRAREFYCGVLGLREVPKPPELAARGGAWFDAGGIGLHLGVESDFRPAGKAHPALRCADYGSTLARLAAAGIPFVEDALPLQGRRHGYTRDPFENRIELIEA